MVKASTATHHKLAEWREGYLHLPNDSLCSRSGC